MRRLIVRPEAEADITKSAIWYASREPELGLEPCGHPNTQLRSPFTIPGFLCIRKSPEVRRVLVKKFPYRIFYIVDHDLLVVFAVLHGARHERIWRQRLLNINRLLRP